MKIQDYRMAIVFTGRLVVVSMLAIGLSGCATTEVDPLSDHSFESDQPCTAPCWYGLRLDESSKSDVLSVLAKLSFVDSNSISTQGVGWPNANDAEGITFDCIHPDLQRCGTAIVASDKLKQLVLAVNYELTLRTSVAKLGRPSYIEFSMINSCIVSFVWQEKGILLRSTNVTDMCQELKIGSKPSPTLLIDTIVYSSQEAFDLQASGCCERVAWPGFVDN